MKFRSDINGLRAIAVIAVVLYHFSVPRFEGGFLGVDVFFVISGFLMTGIIFRGIEKGGFSILTFYKYRARRIIPALAVLCFVLLAVGWFVLLPSEFRALGKEAAASIGFFSNISFWREAGYFDVRSLEKWLLHTWSLSVEWQFYLLYPLLLVALTKWLPAAWVRRWIIVGTGLSFAVCIYLSAPTKWPTAAFYLLPTRAWEMLAGAIVYLYPIRASGRTRTALEWTGLALIAFGLFRFNAQMMWPGWLAIVPVGGTALIIAAARDSWVTGSKPAQFIGKISYSVYLWHWPMVVALSYYGKAIHPIWVGGGIVASFILGYLSWWLVESRTQGKAAAAHTFCPSFPCGRRSRLRCWSLPAAGRSITGKAYPRGSTARSSSRMRKVTTPIRTAPSAICCSTRVMSIKRSWKAARSSLETATRKHSPRRSTQQCRTASAAK